MTMNMNEIFNTIDNANTITETEKETDTMTTVVTTMMNTPIYFVGVDKNKKTAGYTSIVGTSANTPSVSSYEKTSLDVTSASLFVAKNILANHIKLVTDNAAAAKNIKIVLLDGAYTYAQFGANDMSRSTLSDIEKQHVKQEADEISALKKQARSIGINVQFDTLGGFPYNRVVSSGRFLPGYDKENKVSYANKWLNGATILNGVITFKNKAGENKTWRGLLTQFPLENNRTHFLKTRSSGTDDNKRYFLTVTSADSDIIRENGWNAYKALKSKLAA